MATTWQLNFNTLANSDPAAVQLLRLCAFLAPDAIPLALLTADPAVLPNELGAAVSGPLGIDEPLQSLYRFSLVGEDPGGIRVHRLVQAVTRDHLPAQEAIAWAERAAQLLLAVFPSPAEEPAGWLQAAVLLPHVVAATQPVGQADSASPTVARLLNRAGVYLTSRGELADARQTLERALVLAELAYGPNHREVAIILGNLGLVRRHLGELPAARQAQERALDIAEQVYGPNHYEVASILGNLGNLLRDLGDLPAARQALTRALGIFRATLGDDHPRTKQAQRILDGLPGDSL